MYKGGRVALEIDKINRFFFYSSATVLRGKLSILPFISVCSPTKVIGYDKNIPTKKNKWHNPIGRPEAYFDSSL